MKKIIPLLLFSAILLACENKETTKIVSVTADHVAFLRALITPEDLYLSGDIPTLARIPNPKWPGCTLASDQKTIVCPDSSFEFSFTNTHTGMPVRAIIGTSSHLPGFSYETFITATEVTVPDSCWAKASDSAQKTACKKLGGKSGAGSAMWATIPVVGYNVERKHKPLIAPQNRNFSDFFIDYHKNMKKEWNIKI